MTIALSVIGAVKMTIALSVIGAAKMTNASSFWNALSHSGHSRVGGNPNPQILDPKP